MVQANPTDIIITIIDIFGSLDAFLKQRSCKRIPEGNAMRMARLRFRKNPIITTLELDYINLLLELKNITARLSKPF